MPNSGISMIQQKIYGQWISRHFYWLQKVRKYWQFRERWCGIRSTKAAYKGTGSWFPLTRVWESSTLWGVGIGANEGYVSVGISADTTQFAVNTIRSWWGEMGREKYPVADRLLITTDGGGSNGSRNQLWKTELQKFADGAWLDIKVCHFPPGTSKWNKIERWLFGQITKNWRGRPLET